MFLSLLNFYYFNILFFPFLFVIVSLFVYLSMPILFMKLVKFKNPYFD